MIYKTEQEHFWSGEFGDQYSVRNSSQSLLASNLALFVKVFSCMSKVKSILEFGANVGSNINAIQKLIPDIETSAIEINQSAISILKKIDKIKIYEQSIIDYVPDYTRNIVLVKGVLIHIAPDYLTTVYDNLYKSSDRYICIAEYYNPSPIELSYRGHQGRLFKRDFAGEMLDIYKDLSLLNYGFSYRRDVNFPQDDINWFVLEKR